MDAILLMQSVPVNIPGGNPPNDDPGLRPRSPLTVVAPVLVIPEPARTAKLAELLRATDDALGVEALSFLQPESKTMDTIDAMARVDNILFFFIVVFIKVCIKL